ncbi:bifunctional homocysteine S-methyltransferase/methylenetetrahydrofolate reductase [Paenibacillus thermoaerophilus]|uniref:Bifunctional homocysteine S-methyltransferase/methylenetetrahydrofolate reductase n=1 Tax=Paenibacillus thermoaerophilus TaxID=1215385 RepID=A0ABW2UXW9_9BACL|nr:bifunctional homocysteine S-methyltransferase/methylenetetrahydrofolate reductase [Paenibacillus thermoaerophilus]TMV19144.1 bifunctional homocysteine S-methyltransferase/methylenetetrahydrofolate reductase [Paenibacillus thermoaerophilus]
MKPDLKEALKGPVPLLGDGAVGTFLYQLGFPVGISYEELNLTSPDVVIDVHRRYYEAGARVLETNTYSANRFKLERFGLEQQAEAINRAGVRLARQAAGDDAYVVGAVGPIRAGKSKGLPESEWREAFREQMQALLDEGADGLILETFYDLDELLVAIETARSLTDRAVIAQFALEGDATTPEGFPVAEAARRAVAAGADAIGFNCRVGPSKALRLIELLPPELRESVPVSVFPNAGFAEYVDGSYRYGATPEYFADSAIRFAERGAKLIGGCCGTTPEHIAAMAGALAGWTPEAAAAAAETSVRPSLVAVRSPRDSKSPGAEPPARGPTIVDLVRQRHTVVVELDPPRDLDISKFMRGAEALRDAGADSITMADNSLAMTRMSNVPLGYLVNDRLGVRPLIHIACRDRNLIGTQSHLMGLHALGIDHVLAITGDPARVGDLPGATSVFDMTSFDLIRMIKQLNEGVAFSGKPLKQKANFVVGGAFNPNVKAIDKAVARLEKKIECGVDYIMTQPVYDAAMIERVHEATKHLRVPVFIGIMPLISEGNAEYLHNEVPGISLPDEVRKRMAGLKGEEGRREGVRIAKELLDVAVEKFNGIYLMTPMMFYEMTAELTRYVKERTVGSSCTHCANQVK